jgi:hypothetical protein
MRQPQLYLHKQLTKRRKCIIPRRRSTKQRTNKIRPTNVQMEKKLYSSSAYLSTNKPSQSAKPRSQWPRGKINPHYIKWCRPQWPRGLRRRSAAERLLGSWVRMLLSACMFVSCDCCVGSSLCDGLITRSEEFYRLCLSNGAWYGNLKNDVA